MSTTHKIPLAYSPKYLDVLAVCCSDGRYIEAVGKFLDAKGVPQHDLLAFPGGPGTLCRDTASYAECSGMLDAFDFLVESHKTREVLLIAHEHCGYYARRLGVCEEARQVRDLQRVHTRIRDNHPKVKISLYFAHPQKDAKLGFAFEEISP